MIRSWRSREWYLKQWKTIRWWSRFKTLSLHCATSICTKAILSLQLTTRSFFKLCLETIYFFLIKWETKYYNRNSWSLFLLMRWFWSWWITKSRVIRNSNQGLLIETLRRSSMTTVCTLKEWAISHMRIWRNRQ